MGDEDAVVAPEVPTGGLVGQAVLGHQADRQSLDAAGVVALGQSQIGQIDAEAEITAWAGMLGVGDDQIDRATPARIAQVVRGTTGNRVAAGMADAVRATASRVVSAPVFDARLGEILDSGNAFSDVGGVLARS